VTWLCAEPTYDHLANAPNCTAATSHCVHVDTAGAPTAPPPSTARGELGWEVHQVYG